MSDPQSTPDDSSESTPSELPADQTGTGYLERAQGALSALTESRMAMLGLVITFAMLILALGAPIFAPNPPTPDGNWAGNLENNFQPPFWEQGGTLEYPLGTDQQGRGILSRSLYGLRLALIQGTVPVLIAGIIGVTLGLVSGFFGGWVDVVISRVVDTVMSIPLTLFAIAVIAVLGANLFNLVLVIGITQWVPYTRTIRGQTLSIKNEEFIEAQRASGASNSWILRHGIFPNTTSSILVIATLNIAQVMVIAAGLTFLGLGVSPPRADLGLMLATGRNYLTTAWWYGFFPGLFLMLFVLGINLFGDGLRDILDPKYLE
jgi:peptide/nickel transport system permease protein